jgi:superoxide oxidase
MTLYIPAQSRDRSCVSKARRRFDILTIGLHWATVTFIIGMFVSAWLLLAGDREHAAMLLTVHRSLGVVTWAVAIVRLAWRFSYAYLPPFPQNMSKVQQRFAKASEYGLYALLLFQPLTGLAQSLARGRHFMLFAWQVPSVMAGDKRLTAPFHQIHAFSAWVLLGLIALHILAALFHRFVLRDEVLQSMLPWRPATTAADAPKSTFAVAAAAVRPQR